MRSLFVALALAACTPPWQGQITHHVECRWSSITMSYEQHIVYRDGSGRILRVSDAISPCQ